MATALLQQQIFQAIIDNNLTRLKNLASHPSFSVDIRDDNRKTPLMLACEHNQLDMVIWLLSRNPDVNAIDKEGFSSLHYAAQSGSDAIAGLLLLNHAYINQRDLDGYTPLHHAIMFKNVSVVKLLLTNKALVNVAADEHKITPLHCATQMNDGVAAQLLIEHGAALSARLTNGKTALELAAYLRAQQVIDCLINNTLTTQKEIDSIMIQRIVAVMFNCKEIYDLCLAKQNLDHHGGSNDETEMIYIIQPLLAAFIAENPLYQTQLNPILSIFNSYKKIEDLDKPNYSLENEPFIFTHTGYDNHMLYALISPSDDPKKMTLTMAERGAFSLAPDNNGKVKSIRSINFAKHLLPEIIHKLHLADEANRQTAEKILWDEIPHLARSQYLPSFKVRQKPFKNDWCYAGNAKSMLLNLFIKTFDSVTQGRRWYQKFMLFAHEKTLVEYRLKSLDTFKNEIIDICEKKIEHLQIKHNPAQLQHSMRPQNCSNTIMSDALTITP